MTDLFRQALNRLRAFFRKEPLDSDLDAEMAAHLELAIEENLQRGMPVEEARRQALIKFGGLDQAKERHREARGLDLDVLVEVHDEDELDCALDVVEADVIGINNRDLTDFSVDLDRTFELLSDVPAGKTVVSESGIHTRDQLDELERVGVDAVLVGEGLMRAPDVEAAVRALTGEHDAA